MKYFQRDVPTTTICDASKKGLGAVLQQRQGKNWKQSIMHLDF